MTPNSPPYTLYIYVYTVNVFTKGRGEEGGEFTREKVRGAMLHKPGRKYQHD